jgi:hypothetical protein
VTSIVISDFKASFFNAEIVSDPSPISTSGIDFQCLNIKRNTAGSLSLDVIEQTTIPTSSD